MWSFFSSACDVKVRNVNNVIESKPIKTKYGRSGNEYLDSLGPL